MSDKTTKGGGMKGPQKKMKKQAEASAPADFDPALPAARRPLVPTLAWLGILILSLLLQGCPRPTLYWVLDLVFTLGLVAAQLLFLRAMYRGRASHLLPAWKKFTGYCLVLVYVFQALPRIGWKNLGLLGEGRNVFVFCLSLASLAAGLAAFMIAGRPAVLGAFGILSPEEVSDRKLRRKARSRRQKPGFLHGLLEWVDAIAFAAIAVILINIFIFQLYVIPSESMVPGFLIGDRPFTVKLTMGPRIPLTEWRFPMLSTIKRGDVVTIANPRYPENREVNVRKQLAQFVYMLTFTAVNIDRDASGQPKSDPLVKRIVGLPGEQLMMVDDTLYARRSGEADFKPVTEDASWARIDLWKEDPALRAKIKLLPLDERARSIMSGLDQRKNGLDPAAAARELVARAGRIDSKAAAARRRPEPVTNSEIAALRDEALRNFGSGGPLGGAAYIAGLGANAEDLALAMAAQRSPAAVAALAAYAQGASQAAAQSPQDAYARGSRAFNLILKQNLLSRIERDLDLLATGAGFEAMGQDPVLVRLMGESQELRTYLFYFYDSRNFSPFPAGAVLGPDEYFAMGDNRYNSLDTRFREGAPLVRTLDEGDPSSIRYPSVLAPFALERHFIEGRAAFILWPPSRMGAMGK